MRGTLNGLEIPNRKDKLEINLRTHPYTPQTCDCRKRWAEEIGLEISPWEPNYPSGTPVMTKHMVCGEHPEAQFNGHSHQMPVKIAD